MSPTIVIHIETGLNARGQIIIMGLVLYYHPTTKQFLSSLMMPARYVWHWSEVIEGLQFFATKGLETRLRVVTTNVKGSIHG